MIKNIYDEKNKYYKHEYYCDKCKQQIKYGEIFLIETWICTKDFCSDCKMWWDIMNGDK